MLRLPDITVTAIAGQKYSPSLRLSESNTCTYARRARLTGSSRIDRATLPISRARIDRRRHNSRDFISAHISPRVIARRRVDSSSPLSLWEPLLSRRLSRLCLCRVVVVFWHRTGFIRRFSRRRCIGCYYTLPRHLTRLGKTTFPTINIATAPRYTHAVRQLMPTTRRDGVVNMRERGQ